MEGSFEIANKLYSDYLMIGDLFSKVEQEMWKSKDKAVRQLLMTLHFANLIQMHSVLVNNADLFAEYYKKVMKVENN